MDLLCKPAIAVLNRLSYPQKFGLISLLFILPLSLLMYLFFVDIQKSSTLTQKELDGTRYLRPLRHLMQDVPQEMVLAHLFVAGDTTQNGALVTIKAHIDIDFTDLAALDNELGVTLATTTQFGLLSNQWQQLKDNLTGRSANASDARHTEFIAAIRALITQASTQSTLVLDPEYATYYTQYILTTTLPEAQDLLGQAALLERTQPATKLAPESRTRFTILSNALQTNTTTLKMNFATALLADSRPNLVALNDGPLRDYSAATVNFFQALDTALTTQPNFTGKSPLLDRELADTTSANFTLWDKAVTELNLLLHDRLDGFAQRKVMIGGFAFVILLVVAYLLISFYLAVMQMVKRLAAASHQMIHGEMLQTVAITNHDELGRVVVAFNDIASALVETGSTLRLQQAESATTSVIVLARAAELKTTANQHVENNHQQSGIVNQVNVSMQELAAAAQNIAALAQVVRGAAVAVADESARIGMTTDQAVRQSEIGTQAVARTVETSQEGAATYAHLVKTLHELQEKSNTMRRILDILSDIATQTHLLSLNAAIEAAGAGENGERFGVVAQEVKSLADHARVASKDVVEMVAEVDALTATTLTLADRGYAQAQRSEKVAYEAGAIIEEMRKIAAQSQVQVEAIQQAARGMQHQSEMIGVATSQQSEASSTVLDSMARLDAITAQSTTGSQRLFDTAIELAEVARTLNATLAATANPASTAELPIAALP